MKYRQLAHFQRETGEIKKIKCGETKPVRGEPSCFVTKCPPYACADDSATQQLGLFS
jgi:hypothetical protein